LSRRRKSDPGVETTPPEPVEPATAVERRRRTALGWTLIGLAILGGLLLLMIGGARLAVLTPAGRDLVVSFVDGRQIAPLWSDQC
jgi:hypothetical protein